MLEYNKTISKAQVIFQVSAETDIKPIAVKKSSKHNLCARKLKVNGFFIQRTFFSKKEVLVEKKIMKQVTGSNYETMIVLARPRITQVSISI